MYPADELFANGLAASTAALEKFKQWLEAIRGCTPEAASEMLPFGTINGRQQYPFMPLEYLHRSATLIRSINTLLGANGALCRLRSSDLGASASSLTNSVEVPREYDTLDLFATSNIPKGSVILRDSTLLCAIDAPTTINPATGGQASPNLRCEACCDEWPWN